MKKKLSILITLILSFMFCVCGLFACGGLEGDSGEGDNIIQEEQVDWTTIYKVQGSVITGLTSYGSSLNELTIPSKINGISITAIGDWAFGEGQFEKVIISEGIMVIQANAFRECRKLNTIILAESITSIGDTAFGCCYALRNIRIPKNV